MTDQVNDLVSISGERVQGYTVDSNFKVITGRLVDLNLPTGTLTLATATTSANMEGNLNSSGPISTRWR